MCGKWIYREIVAPELLVVVHFTTDASGKPIPHPYDPNLPPEMLTTTKFIDNGERTTMELRSVPTNETAAQREAFNKLATQWKKASITHWTFLTNSSQRFDELRHSNEGEKTWVQQPISFQSPLIGCSSSRAFSTPRAASSSRPGPGPNT